MMLSIEWNLNNVIIYKPVLLQWRKKTGLADKIIDF